MLTIYFPDYGINSILFQRGLYPPESFKADENYGLTILMSTDNKIRSFLSTTLEQLKGKFSNIFCLFWIDLRVSQHNSKIPNTHRRNQFFFIHTGNCFIIKLVINYTLTKHEPILL